MNKEQVKGTAKDLAGKAQQKAGELIDSKEQQAKGLAKQVEGKAEKGRRRCQGSDRGRERSRQGPLGRLGELTAACLPCSSAEALLPGHRITRRPGFCFLNPAASCRQQFSPSPAGARPAKVAQ